MQSWWTIPTFPPPPLPPPTGEPGGSLCRLRPQGRALTPPSSSPSPASLGPPSLTPTGRGSGETGEGTWLSSLRHSLVRRKWLLPSPCSPAPRPPAFVPRSRGRRSSPNNEAAASSRTSWREGMGRGGVRRSSRPSRPVRSFPYISSFTLWGVSPHAVPLPPLSSCQAGLMPLSMLVMNREVAGCSVVDRVSAGLPPRRFRLSPQ